MLLIARRKPGVTRPRWAAIAMSILLTAGAGEARAEDGEPTEMDEAALALLHDMEMMVSNQETTGWTVDDYEYEEMLPDAVYSACLTPKEARASALVWANERVDELGGPLERALAGGRSIDELEDLLFATRVATILRTATDKALQQCSPWHQATQEFRGVQSNAERFTLAGETGGILLLQRTGGERAFGGGFAVRVTAGYGFDHHYSLYSGAELHVTTLVPRGAEETRFPIQYLVAVPVVLRHRFLMWHHDVETGPIVLFSDDNTQPSFGFRVGALVGVSTLRIRHIMPWFGPGLEIEYLFENDARPSIGAVKGGARLGCDWDF